MGMMGRLPVCGGVWSGRLDVRPAASAAFRLCEVMDGVVRCERDKGVLWVFAALLWRLQCEWEPLLKLEGMKGFDPEGVYPVNTVTFPGCECPPGTMAS